MAKKAKRASEDERQHNIEIEQKFEVPLDFTLPDVSDLPGVASVDEPLVHQLEATYLDTADLRLLTRHWELRRRTGGVDAGWHLKRPLAGGDRDELQYPLGRSAGRVPAAVAKAIAVYTRGAEPVPIATLSTTRTVRSLRDPDGAELAQIMLDIVDATALHPDGTARDATTWHEVEVELVQGDKALLRALAERLHESGARPSPSVSKLAHALQARLDAEPLPVLGPPNRYGPATAVGVILGYLAVEVAHLQVNDPEVRVDRPDAVHQTRVASRRLRSALGTFRPLFDASRTDPIRDELKWLGTELGMARDVEVIRDHLLEAVKAEPAELRHGPVAQRIRAAMAERYTEAHAHGVTQLNSQRYFDLLNALDALITDPPLAEHAGALPVEELVRLVRRTWKKISKLHTVLDQLTDPHRRDLQLHEVRKAAKRARYAGEALTATFGQHAKDYADRMAGIQSVLGDHQDTVVIRQELEALARSAEEAGEPSFTYGRLHALEQTRGDRTEAEFAAAWQAATQRSVLHWLNG
jgi:CHAD domain-containing protein